MKDEMDVELVRWIVLELFLEYEDIDEESSCGMWRVDFKCVDV